MKFHEYLAAEQDTAAEIRFYLDETGNESKAFTGVGGVCVINWRQYEKHHAALAKWRHDNCGPETIHFAELDSKSMPNAVSLLSEIRRRRSGLLFLGYSVSSRSASHRMLVSLFEQLVVDAVKHLDELGCIDQLRAVSIYKESERGFDLLHLAELRKQIAGLFGHEFPNRVFLKEIVPIPKGREVLLECADLIAASMQRRALCGGRNPKDRLAEAVWNVTGFEDPHDNGTVFRAYPT